MQKDICAGINKLTEKLFNDQSPDGSWKYPFETGISTDCYMIILLRTLEIDDENLIGNLTKRILSRQEKNGSWKLFHDESPGNLSATLEAYFALLFSGYYDKNEAPIKAAEKFIIQQGGIEKAHMFTKFMLALTGQYKWPRFFPFPLEMILLPAHCPFSFYGFSEYGRANIVPIMILARKRFSLKTADSPDLAHLYIRTSSSDNDFEKWRHFYTGLTNELNRLQGSPSLLEKRALKQAEQYIRNRIEPDGTFLSYFSSTFLMIFAFLSLGYPKTHPLITKAVKGLKNMQCMIDGRLHIQYTTATVWNTALISYSLQETGVPVEHPAIMKANQYLLSRQHYKFGDWVINNPGAFPGGWGFSDINTIHPDVDDTSASLRAIAGLVSVDSRFRNAWDRGMLWLLSMQNTNGGWPAFEKDANRKWVKWLPVKGAAFILTDPPAADLTGRALEFFSHFTRLPPEHKTARAAVEWLINNQEKDGSWYGRWGICYIYGTWAALTGLTSAGISRTKRSVQKAVKWLLEIQNGDGGWGESCKSDIKRSYVSLGASTLTHTAWACDALISVFRKPTTELQKGIKFLIDHLDENLWTEQYPAGQGMAGGFYMHYHSYRYIFPLLAFSHYVRKYSPDTI